jgi:hypothetical protein
MVDALLRVILLRPNWTAGIYRSGLDQKSIAFTPCIKNQ